MLYVVVEPKPPIDRNKSALLLTYLSTDRVHADNPSGLLVVSWRCAVLMIVFKTLNLHIGE